VTGNICFPVAAQSVSNDKPETSEKKAVERIVTESNGNVVIEIPENLLEKLYEAPPAPVRRPANPNANLRPGVNKLSGYRVQVFSDGRNQTTLEARAKARGNAIAARFPKYRGQVYTYSSSPNWFCRVGNFRTQQEASSALSELKRAFPAFSGEMRVVKSQIVIIR